MSFDVNELDAFGQIFWFGFIPIALIATIFVGGWLAKRADGRGRAERDELRRQVGKS